MIGYKYIYEEIPYNRELASEIGIDYANDGKSIRFDPVRVEVESWTEEFLGCDAQANGYHDPNLCQPDCRRCSENCSYDSEVIEIRTPKKRFRFQRTKYHTLGSVWSNWYPL